MLNENLKQLRKSKGLTQEELALQLGVVRQTILKWEKGLSVPDSEMLIEIAERFDVPVSTLLGDTVESAEKDDLIKIMSEKLALINGHWQMLLRENVESPEVFLLPVLLLPLAIWSGRLLSCSIPIYSRFPQKTQVFP